MPSTMVRVLHARSHLISQQPHEVDTVIILTTDEEAKAQESEWP